MDITTIPYIKDKYINYIISYDRRQCNINISR